MVLFPGRELVFGWFLDAFAVAVPAPGKGVAEDVADGLAPCPGEVLRGGGGVAGGVVTGDADGDDERDRVGVGSALAGGFGFQAAWCLADDEECPGFLADQLGRPRSQDEPGAAEPGLELAIAVLSGPLKSRSST